MSTSHYAVINGEFIPEADAKLRISDLSIQRGYGIFDFFKVLDGRPVFLDDHLDRFYRSASLMHLPVETNRDQLKAILRELIDRNGINTSGIRITLTGGESSDGYTIGRPNLIINHRGLPDNRSLGERGLRLLTCAHKRQIPEAKTLDYLMAIWLQPMLRERGADDVLYYQDDMISECPRSNVFVVTAEGQLLTPGHGVLQGVIRGKLLALGAEAFAAEVRQVTLGDLHRASEVLMTSSTKNLISVVEIDGKPVGTGKPGTVAGRLSQMLTAQIHDELSRSAF